MIFMCTNNIFIFYCNYKILYKSLEIEKQRMNLNWVNKTHVIL